MSDLQTEVSALRTEVRQLRSELDTFYRDNKTIKEKPYDLVDQAVNEVRDILAQSGSSRGVGVVRIVILQETEKSSSIVSGIVTTTDPQEMPTEAQLLEKANLFRSGILGLKTLHAFQQQFLTGKEATLRLGKAELAVRFAVSEAELEEALRPLVASNWLSWIKTATGDEAYEFVHNDTSLVYLTFP